MEAIAAGHNQSQRGGLELAKLKQSTRQVVGSVFYGTLLKSMRDSSMKGPYGHGGRGEEVFSAQLHNLLAEKMGEATNGGLADALYDSLSAQQERISKMHDVNRLESSREAIKGLHNKLTSKNLATSTESLF